MKPKLNILKKEVEIAEPVFRDLPSILIGNLSFDTTVFDASAFCESEEIDFIDYDVFFTKCQRYINAKIAEEGVQTTNLFFLNANKHLLINVSLILIYVQFVMPSLTVYFDHIVTECMEKGIAFSDSFAMNLAASRLPDEALQSIIKSREDESE